MSSSSNTSSSNSSSSSSSSSSSGSSAKAEVVLERTLALLKPDVCSRPWVEEYLSKIAAPEGQEDKPVRWDVARETRAPDTCIEIVSRLRAAGLSVVQSRMLHLSKVQAEDFYAEHAGGAHFETLTGFLASGPSLALVLEGPGAVGALRALLGPTDSRAARAASEAAHPLNEELWSLRALFGTDALRNAIHGSSGVHAAAREVAFFFPDVCQVGAPTARREVSVALLLPHLLLGAGGGEKADAIVARLEGEGFHILARKALQLGGGGGAPAAAAAASSSFIPYPGGASSEAFQNALCAGPCEAVVVEGVAAIHRLQVLCGPPPSAARSIAPTTLHALYGEVSVAGSQVGGSAAPSSSSSASEGKEGKEGEGEAADAPPVEEPFVGVAAAGYPSTAPSTATSAATGSNSSSSSSSSASSTTSLPPNILPALFPDTDGALPYQKTLALIKPGAAEGAAYRAILNEIRAAGFIVLAEARRRLSVAEAEAFYAEHAGRPFFARLTQYMASGSLVALALAKPNAIRIWRQMMGPTDTAVAKRDRPASVRARFGVDGTRNATHGSDSVASATRELRFFFPELRTEGGGGAEAAVSAVSAVTAVKDAVITTAYDPRVNAIVAKTLEAVVVDGLSALARSKPSSKPADAIRWLGQWLIDNNPKHGNAKEPTAHSTAVAEAAVGEFVARKQHLAKQQHGKNGSNSSSSSSSSTSSAAVIHAKYVTEPDDDEEQAYSYHPRQHAGRSVEETKMGEASPDSSASHSQSTEYILVLREDAASAPPLSGLCARAASAFGFSHITATSAASASTSAAEAAAEAIAAAIAASPSSRKFLIEASLPSVSAAIAVEKKLGGPPALVLVFSGATASSPPPRSIEASAEFYRSVGLSRPLPLPASPEEAEALYEDALAPLLRPRIAWLAGPPGSGRTSLASELAALTPLTGWRVLNLPALVSEAIATGGPLGEELAARRARGDTVPSRAVIALLRGAFERLGARASYVLESLPRDEEDAEALEGAFGPPHMALHLALEDAQAISRCLAAAAAAAAPTPLSYARAMERRVLAKKQIARFRAHVLPLLEAAEAAGKLRRISASETPQAVLAAARAALSPQYVYVLGAPGVGKGTVCARLRSHPALSFAHLSSGDLLRAEVLRGSPEGREISAAMDAGALVAQHLVLTLLQRAMLASCASRLLLDGFPRELPQAQALEAFMGKPPSAVLCLEGPPEVLIARLIERGKTSGRSDDTEETIKKRFEAYAQLSRPLVSHYSRAGLVKMVDGTQSPDAVYAAALRPFRPRITPVVGPPGAGKSVFSRALAREIGAVPLSLDAILLAAAARAAVSAEGERIQIALSDHVPLPDTLLAKLVARAIGAASPSKDFVLDDFPRNGAQAAALEALMGGTGGVLDAPIVFDAPRKILRERLLKQATVAAAKVKSLTAAALAAASVAPLSPGGSSSSSSSSSASSSSSSALTAIPGRPRTEAAITEAFAVYDAAIATYLSPSASSASSASSAASSPAPAPTASIRARRLDASSPSLDLILSIARPHFAKQVVVLMGTRGSGRREFAMRACRDLGYVTLRASELFRAQVSQKGSSAGAIEEAFSAQRTLAADVAVGVIHAAVLRSGAQRIILEGYPRLISDGYPSVHDQVFALEAKLGPVRGCVFLDAPLAVRQERCGSKAVGEIAEMRARHQSTLREKIPVVNFFKKIDKAILIDTAKHDPDAVFEAARPLLE